jgi:hypothetical protein
MHLDQKCLQVVLFEAETEYLFSLQRGHKSENEVRVKGNNGATYGS